jgi:hypothetical protein
MAHSFLMKRMPERTVAEMQLLRLKQLCGAR